MTDLDFAEWMDQSGLGFWIFNVNTGEVKWSGGFYSILGYEPEEIECSYQSFINELLYYEDYKIFVNSINERSADPIVSTHIRLLTKRGFEWFQSTVQKRANSRIAGSLTPIHTMKVTGLQGQQTVTGKRLLQTGEWIIHYSAGGPVIYGEGLRVVDVFQAGISLESFFTLLEASDRERVNTAIDNCLRYGRPFEADLLIQRPGRKKWVKMEAYAHVDFTGTCIAIKGVFQNIDKAKRKEIGLEDLLNLTNRRKNHLQNFAHIVAHNINNYATNLTLLLDFHEQATDEDERVDFLSKIRGVSAGLRKTIRNLNELVDAEALSEHKSLVRFEEVLNDTIGALQHKIEITGAVIRGDFSYCPEVYYVHAYLDSIFHNLISNALKYREPSRKPLVNCLTEKVNETVYLIIEDNGVGIDMKRYGHQLFGLFQTFHQHDEARGLGLYMTRNQIEQSGGAISVESEPDKGTKFTIRLNPIT